nr:reverse transcriptase domain-containing protein [Tanacetum cinerariifolium]
ENSENSTPKAIISDRGTHFCNDQFSRVIAKYGVTHHLSTAYHPQTSRQVEVTNRGLKRILERTVGENRASWSDKLEDALWAFRTAFKTSALKHANFDLKIAGDHQKLQLNELNKLCDQAYENSLIYKERTKKLHDDKIKNRIFNVGDQVLLFNSRLKIFSGTLKSRWSGPFTISEIYPYETAKLIHPDGCNFKVNFHRLKHYHGGYPPPLEIPDYSILFLLVCVVIFKEDYPPMVEDFLCRILSEQVIMSLTKCMALKERVSDWEWADMMALYCQNAVEEDSKFARRVGVLLKEMEAVYKERVDFIKELEAVIEMFVDELDMLAERHVPDKIANFIKQIQGKYIPNLMKLQILGREFELKAQEKGIFIEKLKGN